MDGLSSNNGYMHSVVLHKNSLTNKRRLKFAIGLHVVLLLAMSFRLSTSFFVLLNIRPPPFLQMLRFPRPWIWEYFWLLSSISVIFGIASLRRNRLIYLTQYIVSLLVFGILPTLYGIFDLSDELLEFFESHQTKRLLFGIPVIVLWNMFLAASVQVQAFGAYFGWNLRATWKARAALKKSKQ